METGPHVGPEGKTHHEKDGCGDLCQNCQHAWAKHRPFMGLERCQTCAGAQLCSSRHLAVEFKRKGKK